MRPSIGFSVSDPAPTEPGQARPEPVGFEGGHGKDPIGQPLRVLQLTRDGPSMCPRTLPSAAALEFCVPSDATLADVKAQGLRSASSAACVDAGAGRRCAQCRAHNGRRLTLMRHSYRSFGRTGCTSTEDEQGSREAAFSLGSQANKSQKSPPRIGQSAHEERPEHDGDLGSFWAGDVAACVGCGWWEQRYEHLWRCGCSAPNARDIANPVCCTALGSPLQVLARGKTTVGGCRDGPYRRNQGAAVKQRSGAHLLVTARAPQGLSSPVHLDRPQSHVYLDRHHRQPSWKKPKQVVLAKQIRTGAGSWAQNKRDCRRQN
ncbi:hypothetical protein CCMA1212_006699 [Trichoderma ghanense]|uniref:Uncharacterized protein n=1 Tax=Trichoderma ghanense TaxID=65468 RepID=A0ABY2H1P0_9HYPO